jgi:hypothetical protein
VTFILNEFEIESAQRQAAEDFHRPNAQAAVLTLSRLMEWVNNNSDGWAYWAKPSNASTKLQRIVETHYGYHASDADVNARDLKAAYTPIKAFLTRQGVAHSEVFING